MRVPSHGRAIVRRISPHAESRTYRPGDFVLVRSGGTLAAAQEVASGGPFHHVNHAALIVDPTGGLIEIDPRLAPGTARLRRTHLSDYLAANIPCWVGYVELQAGTRHLVVDFAERLLASEARLSTLGAATLLLHLLVGVAPREHTAHHAWLRPLHPVFDNHALVLREEHTWLAGEFVARALERAGFMWDRDPAYITPAELFARFHLRDEAEGGVVVPLTAARRAPRTGRVSPAPRGPEAVSSLAHYQPSPGRWDTGLARHAALVDAIPQRRDSAAPDGVRAMVRVALLALGGIALAHSIESLMRQVRGA